MRILLVGGWPSRIGDPHQAGEDIAACVDPNVRQVAKAVVAENIDEATAANTAIVSPMPSSKAKPLTISHWTFARTLDQTERSEQNT